VVHRVRLVARAEVEDPAAPATEAAAAAEHLTPRYDGIYSCINR
jgi:hypothetical protein